MKWIFWCESDRTWSNSCQLCTPERVKHSWRFQLGFSNLLEDWFFLAECDRTLFSLLTRYPGDPLGQAFVAGVQNEWVVKSVALTGRTWCSVRWSGSDSPEVCNWSLRERRWGWWNRNSIIFNINWGDKKIETAFSSLNILKLSLALWPIYIRMFTVHHYWEEISSSASRPEDSGMKAWQPPQEWVKGKEWWITFNNREEWGNAAIPNY